MLLTSQCVLLNADGSLGDLLSINAAQQRSIAPLSGFLFVVLSQLWLL
jgi:hypothetical protein